jgi:hypothetical protein
MVVIDDACDITLSVYPHLAGLENMPGHGPIEPTTFGKLAQYIDIEGTRLSSEKSHTRTDLTA